MCSSAGGGLPSWPSPSSTPSSGRSDALAKMSVLHRSGRNCNATKTEPQSTRYFQQSQIEYAGVKMQMNCVPAFPIPNASSVSACMVRACGAPIDRACCLWAQRISQRVRKKLDKYSDTKTSARQYCLITLFRQIEPLAATWNSKTKKLNELARSVHEA